ncbi:MAG TPA: hypothetical protein V6D08_08955 [Candidatus Obscuribacterales bacterium]
MSKGLSARASAVQHTTLSLACAVVAAVVTQPVASAAPVTAAAKTAQTEFHPADIQLKHVRDAARRLRSAALMLIDDVEQRDMVVTGEPMIIQPIPMKDDTHPIGWAQKMEDLGPALPPRKKWLDLDMAAAGRLVDALQQETDAVQFPSEKNDKLAPAWSEVKSILEDTRSQYRNLQDLTQGPTYDNIKIGQAALSIYNNMGKLDKPLKEVISILRSRR